MITWRKGDLFESGLGALAHGCNCRGVMGAGIAVQFRTRWPLMYDMYVDRCVRLEFLPGDVMTWEPSKAGEPYVFNLATQMDTGADATQWMIAAAVGAMIQIAHYDYGIKQIGLPAIGCGIGGLTTRDLSRCLAPYRYAPVDLIVYELEGRK